MSIPQMFLVIAVVRPFLLLNLHKSWSVTNFQQPWYFPFITGNGHGGQSGSITKFNNQRSRYHLCPSLTQTLTPSLWVHVCGLSFAQKMAPLQGLKAEQGIQTRQTNTNLAVGLSKPKAILNTHYPHGYWAAPARSFANVNMKASSNLFKRTSPLTHEPTNLLPD